MKCLLIRDIPRLCANVFDLLVSSLPRLELVGLDLYGTQYGSECRGGNDLVLAKSLGALSESNCHIPCGGMPSIMCGGNFANSLYTLGTYIHLHHLHSFRNMPK